MDQAPTHTDAPDTPLVTIEMGGDSLVVRPGRALSRACTESLAEAVNAASAIGTTVILDPDPHLWDPDGDGRGFTNSNDRDDAVAPHNCPLDVEVVRGGMIRIRAAHVSWVVDLALGRMCQIDDRVDSLFVPADAWTDIVAIGVTRASLVALTVDGTRISSRRPAATTEM